MAFDTLQIKAVEGLLSFKNENDLFPPPRGGNSHMKQTGMLVGNFEFNP